MAYLGLDENPALFTAENANTCHLLALTVAFDPAAAQPTSDRAVVIIRATQAGDPSATRPEQVDVMLQQRSDGTSTLPTRLQNELESHTLRKRSAECSTKATVESHGGRGYTLIVPACRQM
jgi:hypothetical protein